MRPTILPALTVLETKLAVSRLKPDQPIPDWALKCNKDLLAITYTSDELSILCEQEFVPDDVQTEKDWRALKVIGPLDFSLTGLLAELLKVLADKKISIFAISTFDTDYVLVKKEKLAQAVAALKAAGYTLNT